MVIKELAFMYLFAETIMFVFVFMFGILIRRGRAALLVASCG